MDSGLLGLALLDAKPTSERIRLRIKRAGAPFLANDNISEFIAPGELDELQREIEKGLSSVLSSLVIDTENDHNTQETAKRVAKMYLREVFGGRYVKRPDVTDFPNAKNLDQLYTVGPITVRSACSHHMCPIQGHAWVGVIPSERVIGLSKFTRLAEWVMARPQIQEEAVVQLADLIESLIKPRGLAVVVKATHSCMTWRGVKDTGTTMTTSVMRGLLRNEPAARAEFMALIEGQRYTCT
jgi:GTP cyclohydrolase I